jgi:hypothetical protein
LLSRLLALLEIRSWSCLQVLSFVTCVTWNWLFEIWNEHFKFDFIIIKAIFKIII